MRNKFFPLFVAASLAAGMAHADVYVDGGLRNLTGTGHQLTGTVGADTELGRSGIRAGAELSHSFGNTSYSSAAGVLSYEGRSWSPYVKVGKTFGDLEGTLKGVGVEYHGFRPGGGWSAGVELNKVSLDKSAAEQSVKGANVFLRYRF